MKTLIHILSFEWKMLWRSNIIKLLLLVIFGAGIYGIYFGKFEIDKQEERISQVKQYERQKFDRLLHWAKLDTTITENKQKFLQAVSPTGVDWNKHFTFYKAHKTPIAAGLCLGQRDLFPVYFGINLADLARQVNISELANPMKLLSGNFDLSYVFTFLFPLLIVALFYNIYAGEKESGTLTLLQSQSVSLATILLSKGLLKLIIVWGLAIILLILGFILQGISLSENLLLLFQWILVVCSYQLMWVIIMGFIIWIRLRTAVSAIAGLGIWVIFTLITPTLINLFVLANEPLPNRAEMSHAIRNLNGKIWDAPKSYVFDQFYNENPNLNKGDTTDFNKFYYASFTLLDKEANRFQIKFETQIRNRNSLIEKWKWLTPAAHIHEKLSQLSGTDRNSHLKFLQEIHEYHQELKKIYFERIFDGKHFSFNDLKTMEKNL